MEKEIKKIGEITGVEIHSGWKILYELGTRKPFWYNSALIGITKSAALVGGGYHDDVVYLPHKFNLNTNSLEIFEGDFMLGGLDPNIRPPFPLKN